ncbi:MAG: hypothetical protein GH151_10205 [Bacteroidetes bacterium]|nr:hypothetical protein [Bacteroidota bacterium]
MVWALLNSDMLIKKFLKDYFSFSKSERNGILVLIFFICILLIVNGLLPYLQKNRVVDFSEFENEIQEFEKQLKIEKQDEDNNNDQWSGKDARSHSQEFFPFDPNQTTRKDWERLGLTDKQINTIFNYLNSGGKFYKKEDLAKIYNLSRAQYETLEPYIRVEPPASHSPAIPVNQFNPEPNEHFIEINSADTADLMSLWGVGPVFARRIIKYRDLLGGFVSKDQLLEVYGFKQETLKRISPVIDVDSVLIIKININEATYRELIRHPYLNEYQVRAILNYRKLKGRYTEVKELTENKLLPQDTFLRVRSYLCVE